MSGSSPDRSTELLQLMMKYQRRIFAYIHTLVPSRSDAEDILQEASLTICEKFNDFELGTITLFLGLPNCLLEGQSSQKIRNFKVVFNQEVLDVISQTRTQMEDEFDVRHEALSRCLQKLNDRDRRMVLTR